MPAKTAKKKAPAKKKTRKIAKEDILKSQYGSVRPYTRHVEGCKVKDNSCSCPKYLYVNKRGERDIRYALNTPSWADAMKEAADKLKSLDPEIAASREATAKQERTRKTVYQAINLWIDRTKTKLGDDAAIVGKYRSTFGWVDDDGVKRGGMLRYAAERKLEYIDDFTPLVCQEWLDSDLFPAYSAYNKHVVWGTVKSFFNFLVKNEVIKKSPVEHIDRPEKGDVFAHSPYTDEQYKLILEQADWYVDDRVRNGEREIYCQRMRSFLELLRWSGMDVIDAVMFQPSQIEDQKIDKEIVSVLRYRRTKTRRKVNLEAVIPLSKDVAKLLRKIPMCPKSVDGMPFRYQGNDVRSDVHNWSRRVGKLVALAGITEIPLLTRDNKPALDEAGNQLTTAPDCKMFRHTFAVGELVKGVPDEVVSRMLGHVDTTMLRMFYAPWVKSRDEGHIRLVLTGRSKKASR